MVLGHVALDSAKLDSVLTGFIAEALKNTDIPSFTDPQNCGGADATAAPVMKGKIKECWMDMYMVANAQIKIDLVSSRRMTRTLCGSRISAAEK